MIKDTVLLTRVGEDNRRIKSALEETSLKLLHRPILNIEPIPLGDLSLQRIQNLDLYDHIIFISTNAVIHGLRPLMDRWPQWPIKLKWYAVGNSTASQLRLAQVFPLVPEEFSSEGLLRLPELLQVENERVLIVRGLGGRETLKETLIKRKAVVDYLEVYHRLQNKWPGGIVSKREVAGLLASVVYSADSLLAFDQMISEPVRRIPLLVPSDRVRQLALAKGYTSVISTPPTDDAIVKQLRALQNADSKPS